MKMISLKIASKSECNCAAFHPGHHHGHHHHQQHHHQSASQLPLPLPLPAQASVAASSHPGLDPFVRKTVAPGSSSSSSVCNSNDNSLVYTASNSTTASIETAAKKYRFAAQNSEATCCWKGKLPPKQYKPPLVYSTKVFVGGLPWDICEADLCKEFGVFGPCRIEWTNKDRYNMMLQQQQQQQTAYPGDFVDSQHSFRFF